MVLNENVLQEMSHCGLSIIEQYGQPAQARCLKSNLRTDFDVMFVFNEVDMMVELGGKNSPLKNKSLRIS